MMKPTKSAFFMPLLAIAVVGLLASSAAAQQWTTNFAQALQASQRTGKPLLVNFTGSDWCGWCIRLKDEVFDKPEFKRWAAENVILVELDFPQRKSQPAALKTQNERLRAHYQPRGYPTILFLNGKGEVVCQSGYRAGGPKAWIEHAQKIVDAAKPKPAEATSDFIAAHEQAAKSGKALMVILETRPAPANDRRVEELLSDVEFAELANARIEIVRLQKEGENAAPAEQIEAAEKLLDAVKARPGALRTAIIDPTGDEPKLLFDSPSLLPGKTYATRVKDQLPEPKYDGSWVTDYEQAKQFAKQLDRPMLMNFTGSDWCPPCKALESTVFETAEFQKWARENVILVKLDFPQQKQLSAAEQQQNRALAVKHEVQGFPTVLLLDAEEKVVGRTGFRQGGAKPYIQHLEGMMKKN
jgi:protein disulfide-isomerase